MLREIGLLVPSDLAFKIHKADEDAQTVYVCGNTCIIAYRRKGTPQQSVNVIAFSEIGKELLRLVEKTPAPPAYVQKFASLLRCEGVTVKAGEITAWEGDSIRYNVLAEIPTEHA